MNSGPDPGTGVGPASNIPQGTTITRGVAEPGRQAAEWSRQLEGTHPRGVLRWAADHFGDGLVIGSSFGKDGLAILDLTRSLGVDVPVLFLDTGYHFPETLEFRDRIRREWGLTVVDVRPALSVAEQEALYGAELFARDPDKCCEIRKIAPLQRALVGKKAWVSGVRRDQHPGRSRTPVVEWQQLDGASAGLYKVNPMVGWSRAEVEAYLEARRLPRHPMWDRGFPSIGCSGCTTPVSPGSNERDGRWAGKGKTECGIHVVGIQREGAGSTDGLASSSQA